MSTIYKVKCIYKISYDIVFMGTVLESHVRRFSGTDVDGFVGHINTVLSNHKNDMGTVQNIKVEKAT